MSAWRGPGDGARTEEGDQGSATVVAAVVTAALLVLGGLVLHLGGATVQRRQAAGAADLAALAAAGDAVLGEEVACGRARWVAERMGATLLGCRLEQWDALVEVQVRRNTPLPGLDGALARARAGPATVTSGSP
ncbi:MAG TPA: Rv3654c family TadE-like protein [Pseudonocardiaceae bacterium]